ncbi:MAG: tryptophan synthase subunit alpha [Calditrichaeota bacterium]|nr:tryptophan synthase subunit alpha [Calditrichota bacterium]
MGKRLRERIERNIEQGKKMLSLFLTAGYPKPEMTNDIIRACDKAGVDFIELGIPFSDPIADGPVIQKASDIALKNGINLNAIFETVKKVREESDIPIILMGYVNPVFQMGFERFFETCANTGVDGLILPDFPIEESSTYFPLLKKLDIDLIHLIAPNTKPERIEKIDRASTAFVYCTAYTGVTGKDNRPLPETERFLREIGQNLNHPVFIGFGIKTAADFQYYTRYAAGVIVGSAFIKYLSETDGKEIDSAVRSFISNIR